jgi:methylenetetrahydrofolate dehydrogenase (NADP+) / methenyltetrahydrofolate cyclohydrolase
MSVMEKARVIDGKVIAARMREDIAREVAALNDAGCQPGLAVVLVGDDPASQVYVRNKARQTREVGMVSLEHRLPENTSQDDLLALISSLNEDRAVHGILVQLPLPSHMDEQTVLRSIDPAKDVDGFHPLNTGLLAIGEPHLVPCTPVGAMALVRSVREDIRGLHAVVVGRSNIVGKPVAQLLLAADCTVTIAHSRTQDLPSICRQADILIVAVGRAELVRGDWIKEGAIVVDVGINRVTDPDGKARLVGDVAFEEAVARAGAVTPVPGGAGPMTIACLLQNTLIAARERLKAEGNRA